MCCEAAKNELRVETFVSAASCICGIVATAYLDRGEGAHALTQRLYTCRFSDSQTKIDAGLFTSSATELDLLNSGSAVLMFWLIAQVVSFRSQRSTLHRRVGMR